MNVKLTRKQQQSEQTRQALLDAARALFTERGFAAVGTEEIVDAAGVTRGALYHQFANKRDLFLAVYEQVERETVERVASAALAGGEDPWDVARIGWQTFLDVCREPSVRRIGIIEAPAVLGFEQWREIADRYGGALVEGTLSALIEQGLIERQPTRPLGRIFTGALIEGAMLIAEADDSDQARKEVGAAIERIMDGLRIDS
jgi:AcrR family transcriptional regulator